MVVGIQTGQSTEHLVIRTDCLNIWTSFSKNVKVIIEKRNVFNSSLLGDMGLDSITPPLSLNKCIFNIQYFSSFSIFSDFFCWEGVLLEAICTNVNVTEDAVLKQQPCYRPRD